MQSTQESHFLHKLKGNRSWLIFNDFKISLTSTLGYMVRWSALLLKSLFLWSELDSHVWQSGEPVLCQCGLQIASLVWGRFHQTFCTFLSSSVSWCLIYLEQIDKMLWPHLPKANKLRKREACGSGSPGFDSPCASSWPSTSTGDFGSSKRRGKASWTGSGLCGQRSLASLPFWLSS